MRRKYPDRYLILLLPILYVLLLVYIRFTIWLIILWLLFNVLRVLFKCIRLISLPLIRGFRWLIQRLRNYFPPFDYWIKNSFNPVVQRFQKTVELSYRKLITLPYMVLFLIVLGGYYIHWTKLYFRDRHEAADPETNPERLRKLSEGVNPNPLLCRVIARNPNTPTDVLLKLGEKFPKQLLANPIFDLLLLEDPNLLKTMPRDTLKSLLRLKEIPIGFLEQAASYYPADVELMKVIAKHPKTPKYVLEKLTQHN